MPKGEGNSSPIPKRKGLFKIMETKDTCKILLEKATQKVKCYKFISKEINRELALHEDVEDKNKSSVTDVVTGMRLFIIPNKVSNVKETDIKEGLTKFINHFTLDGIKSRVAELEKTTMEEKFKGRK